MCFVWIWEQTAIISLYSITWLLVILSCAVCTVHCELNLYKFVAWCLCFKFLNRPYAAIPVHHLPWAVGSYVIGQEIYSICVTKKLMKIQVYQHLTLSFKMLEKYSVNETASHPRTVSPVTQHPIPELLPHWQCHITKLLPWWRSVTSQNYLPSESVTSPNYSHSDTASRPNITHPVTHCHIPADLNCHKHCCETPRHFGVCMWYLDNTLLIDPVPVAARSKA